MRIHTFTFDDEWGYRVTASDRELCNIGYKTEALAIEAARKEITKYKRRQPRKPVHEVTVKEMWTYEFQAKRHEEGKPFTDPGNLLASNSLENLKQAIKERKWNAAWLSCSEGSFSYGQHVVDEYPYSPRRR